MSEVKLTLGYDKYEAKTSIESKLAELAKSPDASNLVLNLEKGFGKRRHLS